MPASVRVCEGCCEITSCVKLCELRMAKKSGKKLTKKGAEKGERIFMHVAVENGSGKWEMGKWG